MREYKTALLGELIPKRRKFVGAAPGSMAALIASYKRSTAYTKLRATTKAASRIEALRENHGHRSVAGLTKERIEGGILTPYDGKPGAQLAMLKMLRILIRHAMSLKPGDQLRLNADPSRGIRRPRGNEIRAWTDTEVAAFEARWPLGTKQRTAYALMLYIGAARADGHRMTWAQFDEGVLNMCEARQALVSILGFHASCGTRSPQLNAAT